MPPGPDEWSVDDLPSYSPWPARIVGVEPWSPAVKSRSEVLREFDVEKWGGLLLRARTLGDRLTLAELESATCDDEVETLVLRSGSLSLVRAAAARAEAIPLLAETLASHGPIETLVDLGAGYGGTLFPLLRELRDRHADFSPMRVVAGELTRSGRELLTLLSDAEGVRVQAVECDLATEQVMAAPPVGATVVTSFSMTYLASTSACLEQILSWKPRLVLHFEPLLEHASSTTMLGLLQRRYIELNDYNQEMLTSLRHLQVVGKVDIVEERSQVLGVNPLLPGSIVVWRPNGSH